MNASSAALRPFHIGKMPRVDTIALTASEASLSTGNRTKRVCQFEAFQYQVDSYEGIAAKTVKSRPCCSMLCIRDSRL